MELRLLTDADYAGDFDLAVDTLVEQYVDGELSAEDRDSAEKYFFASAERRDKLKFALALKRRREELLFSRRRGRRLYTFYLPVAASVLVVLGLGFAVRQIQLSRPSDLSKGLDALNAAFREQRPIKARISGFGYAPMLEERGGTERVDYVQRDRAARLLLASVDESPSADANHALGKYYLAERQFDKAIDQFEAALRLDPQNARVHNDLGAALFEKGKSSASTPEGVEGGEGIEEFAESLTHFKKALELDNSLIETLFNRALLYQQMGLLEQAEADWRSYLERDKDSKWADEARQQLNELEKRRDKTSRDGEEPLQDFFNAYERGDDARAWEAVRRSYTSAGNAITNSLLDSYLDSEKNGGDKGARDELQALAYVGRLELQRAGDTYTSELARFYGRSTPTQRRSLALAREQMKEGYRLFLSSDVDKALGHYARAKQIFDESGDECEATFAEYRIGHSYLLQPDLEKSEAIFGRLRPACERKSYRWLLNQTLYRTASIRLTFNDYSESIDYARQALKQSEQMQDTTGMLNTLVLLADQYRSINNQRQSLSFLRRALALARDEGAEPLQTWGMFTAIGLNLNALDLHPAALEYQKEALRMALGMKPERPLIVSRSYDYLGLTYGRMKDYDSALANIALAFEASRKLAEARSGLELMANSSLHAGDVYRQAGDCDNAIESYERSTRLYGELNYPYYTYPARKGKLLCYLARGDDSAVETELHSVLEIFERYRSKLTSESQRNTFFDVEQSIYDLAVDFAQVRRHNPQLAFEYSELSRARSLGDAIRRNTQAAGAEDPDALRLPNTFTPLALPDIQQRMPEQSQIVQYAVLNDKLVIWVVTRAGVASREVPLDSRALSEKVRAYLRAIDGPSKGLDEEAARGARELYDVLITPVEPLLDKTKLLCIVPDKVLHYLPFAALVATGTGRYLLEDFRLTLSPSSTIFVDRSEQAARKAGVAEERLLSVGDPSFDGDAFPTLERLPSAGREAEAVTAFYKTHHLLLHADASERAVTSEIVKATVAHLALHYVVDERSDQFSELVLASARGGGEHDKDDDGVWQVREIYKLKLPEMRLVVLPACQTGIEHQYRGEGAVSVARPFLAAGVPLVVASLWPVDSQSTESLMVSFHRHRTLNRLPTAEALRRAQLEMLHGDDTRYRHPYYWAAFNTIGGYTEY